MKLFIDSADINEIKKAVNLGILDGVTTNPSLIAKTGKSLEVCIKEILDVVSGPVNVEVLAIKYKDILVEAKKYVAWGENIVVKVPIIEDGLRAAKTLYIEEGIKVNITLCFSPIQALMAAKVKAAYVSLFLGRLDDISHDGMAIVEQVRDIYTNYSFNTEILIASVRHPMHVLQAALIGVDIATIPLNVIEYLFQHPLTNVGLKQFLIAGKDIKFENII